MTRRRALRFSLLAALCLFLGAATTVGVAWGCAMPTARKYWLNPMGVPGAWEVAREYEYLGCSARIELRPKQPHERFVLEAGWPIRAARSDFAWGFASPTLSNWQFLSWAEGVTLPNGSTGRSGRFTLPVSPLWAGFAINTALYELAWYFLIFTPLPLYRAGRRRLRVSRGKCGSCGYDLKGSAGAVCPECGKETKV